MRWTSLGSIRLGSRSHPEEKTDSSESYPKTQVYKKNLVANVGRVLIDENRDAMKVIEKPNKSDKSYQISRKVTMASLPFLGAFMHRAIATTHHQ